MPKNLQPTVGALITWGLALVLVMALVTAIPAVAATVEDRPVPDPAAIPAGGAPAPDSPQAPAEPRHPTPSEVPHNDRLPQTPAGPGLPAAPDGSTDPAEPQPAQDRSGPAAPAPMLYLQPPEASGFEPRSDEPEPSDPDPATTTQDGHVQVHGEAQLGVVQAFAIAAPGLLLAWLLRRLVLLSMGARLERQEAAEHPLRRRILDHVEAHPGATAAECTKVLGVAPSRAAYHIAILRREGLVRARRIDGRKRLFAANAPVIDESILPFRDLTRPEAQTGRILAILREAPGPSLSELARRLGVSPGMVHYHVQKLDEVGIVKRERRGRRVRHYLTRLGHDIWARFAPQSSPTSTATAAIVKAPMETRSANGA